MRFAVIGSGSKGNCVVVQAANTMVVVDAGYAPRELRKRLVHLGTDLSAITGLCITHGHGDHIKGARALAGPLGFFTYATDATQRFCAGFGGLANHVAIDPGVPFTIGARP